MSEIIKEYYPKKEDIISVESYNGVITVTYRLDFMKPFDDDPLVTESGYLISTTDITRRFIGKIDGVSLETLVGINKRGLIVSVYITDPLKESQTIDDIYFKYPIPFP